jgi:hypothetical protein
MAVLENTVALEWTEKMPCVRWDDLYASAMHLSNVALILFLRVISAAADDLPVIKDIDASSYAGKEAEVRGVVASVTISPLGTAFISFGKEFPNQCFAGYIEVGSPLAADPGVGELPGKAVAIIGLIELHLGKPEIKVTSKDQIKVLLASDLRAESGP